MKNFLERAKIEYGVTYDFSKTIFEGNCVPIIIICPDHGKFNTTPDNFLYNRGCPECRGVHLRGYPSRQIKSINLKNGKTIQIIKKKCKPGRITIVKRHYFYIHYVSGGFLKIGITSDSVESRRLSIEKMSDFTHKVIFVKEFKNRKLLESVEKSIKLSFKTGVAPPETMRDGATETIASKHLTEIVKIAKAYPSLFISS